MLLGQKRWDNNSLNRSAGVGRLWDGWINPGTRLTKTTMKSLVWEGLFFLEFLHLHAFFFVGAGSGIAHRLPELLRAEPLSVAR